MKIDFVFPYVDNNDENWQKLYEENVNKGIDEKDKRWTNWSTGKQRFRSNGFLKYVLRSVAKYAPYINKVHMLVQSPSQVPDWVNTKTVHVVYHKEFIPEEYLPTFNSGTIEMFLHNIPELSENFIYGNDDTFFTYISKPNHFFKEGKLVYKVNIRPAKRAFAGDILRLWDQTLLGITTSTIKDIQHTFMPYKKSMIQKVFDLYKNQILESLTQFRSKTNYNQWIFSLYAWKNRRVINQGKQYYCCEITDRTLKTFLKADWKRWNSICLNDSPRTTEKNIKDLTAKFESYFPKKCKYEK